MKSILFFTRYPTVEQERDGYFQRVLEIDALLKHLKRYYIQFDFVPGRWPKREEIREHTIRVVINPGSPTHWIYLIALALQVRRVYSHSVLNLSNALARFIFRIPFMDKVLDLHGVVPEEFRLYGDFLGAQNHDDYEAHAIHHSSVVLVVSNAMGAHLRQKYPEKKNLRTITLPIFSNFEKNAESVLSNYLPEKPTVIYAGGTQKWQQIDSMVDVLVKTFKKVQYFMFVPEPQVIEAQIRKVSDEAEVILSQVPLKSLPKSALPEFYGKANFGFVLREDITVNRVACPTKIIEYLQFGIIPVVNSAQIGDFGTFGMKVLFRKDLLENRWPSPQEFAEMRASNFSMIGKLEGLSKRGSRELQEFFQ